MAAARPLPSVTLKLATSLDGRIALASGESRWITGPQSRARVHAMRADHDAVLTGIGTVLADAPLLTARTDPPAARQPLRVVLDTHGRCPPDAPLLSAPAPAPLVLVGPQAGAAGSALVRAGAEVSVLPVDPASGRVDLAAALAHLAGRGVRRVMVEAGGTLAGALVRAGLVDTLVWFRAPLLIGGTGRPVLDDLAPARLAEAPRLVRVDIQPCGDDLMETYRRSG